MVIYDLSFFDQTVATLPESWVEQVTEPTRGTRSSSSIGISRSAESATSGWAALAIANIGDRNNQLNQITFSLALRGQWNEETEHHATELAKDRGLNEDEIKATIASAFAGARRQRHEPERWYAVIEADERLRALRNRQALLRAVAQLRELAAVHGMTFGLAVRDLAERLGTSHQAAARYLRRCASLGTGRGFLP